MARVLFHIDLNAFFASAEELRHPEAKGKPMAIGSNRARSVIATANYEARAKGIHSAMPVSQALKLDPDLILIPGDMEYYRKLSSQFFELLKTYSPALEPVSIDECFLDVTKTIASYPRPMDLAFQIQQDVYKKLGLKCSIGVAPTRFLAKIASDMDKPMGITVLRKSEIERKLDPLPIEKMLGIGAKTLPKIKALGIETIGDAKDEDVQAGLQQLLGNTYNLFVARINGRSSDRLSFSKTRKSVSHSTTFSTDLYTLEEVLDQARNLCRQLCDNMVKHKRRGAQISVILRDGDFHNIVKSMSLKEYTNSFPMIYHAVELIITENFKPVGYRHIGISIGSLENEEQIMIQPALIPDPLDSVLSSLNGRLDSLQLSKASDLLKKEKQS